MTPEQIKDFHMRIMRLAADVEDAEGENAAGCYPGRLSMLLHLALGEAFRMSEDATRNDSGELSEAVR